MNNGVANQATRCFRRIVDAFGVRVRDKNPNVELVFRHVQPRNLGELPANDEDLVLSSGGPGSPFDGYDEPWCTGYRKFLDHVVERNDERPVTAPKIFVVCHSFELSVVHFGVAEMKKRESLKFGLMPAYMTPEGESADYLSAFGYRLFCWEHRNWEAVGLDTARLEKLRGAVLARETAEGGAFKGDAILGLRFAPGVDGTQFHPEADKPGVLNWIERPEHKVAVQDAYGEALYERMVKSLGNPERLAKTFALVLPGWLTTRFNLLAQERGYKPLDPPVQDMAEFDVAV
jgi:homoserine O-succinyltransferase